MGQDWSVTRRVMAWKPRMSTDSDTIPVVWTDQARRQPVPSPVNRPTSERIDERRRDVRDTSSGGGGRVGWILLLVVFWPYLVLEAIVTVLVHGAFYVISGVLSVLCTPFVLLARWTGLAPLADRCVDRRHSRRQTVRAWPCRVLGADERHRTITHRRVLPHDRGRRAAACPGLVTRGLRRGRLG